MASIKIGDKVRVHSLPYDSRNGELTVGSDYEVTELHPTGVIIFNNRGGRWHVGSNHITQIKGINMLDSVKDYLKENKSIIMTIAVVLIVDHLIFGGAFREKVKSLVNGLLDNAQKDLDKKA